MWHLTLGSRTEAAIEHEVGVLLKLRIGLTTRQWSLPGYDMMAGVITGVRTEPQDAASAGCRRKRP